MKQSNKHYPRTSYGIIAYSKDQHQQIKFLLIQRKYSHSYIAILRGHYKNNTDQDKDYLESLIKKITPIERNKLLNYDHEYLWEKLWSFSNNNAMFKQESARAKTQFDKLKPKLSELFQKIPAEWNEPEWGFPKGKRCYNERETDTALREFLEETGVPVGSISLHTEVDIPPIYEEYIGDDGVNYRHIYYLGTSNLPGIGFTNPWSLTQIGEVGKIGWFTPEQCQKMLRPYHNSRIDTIKTITKYLDSANE